MGIFISIMVIVACFIRLMCIFPDDGTDNFDDDMWWLLTGQEPVKWDKLDEYKTKKSSGKNTF